MEQKIVGAWSWTYIEGKGRMVFTADHKLKEGFPPDEYAMGSREEAVVCADELDDAWHETPGAVEWLAAHAPRDKRRKRRRR